jgi:zinc/manganese transport system substrate-binding protein
LPGQSWTGERPPWGSAFRPSGFAIGAYQNGWTYLEAWLGLREAGTVQPKPGIQPGSQHLEQIVAEWPAKVVRGMLYAAYENPRVGVRRPEHPMPAIMLPYTVGGTDRARDLFGLFDDTVESLAQRLAGAASARR